MDVTPRFKDAQGRPWVCRAGSVDCTRSVPCASCRGRRNRRSGQRKQREAAKALGIHPVFYTQRSNEETWGDERLRWEVKSGKQVQAMATRFLAAEAQSEASRAVGDARPFAFVAMPAGMGSEGIVAVRLSVWKTLW